jgi:hypothetical protein
VSDFTKMMARAGQNDKDRKRVVTSIGEVEYLVDEVVKERIAELEAEVKYIKLEAVETDAECDAMTGKIEHLEHQLREKELRQIGWADSVGIDWVREGSDHDHKSKFSSTCGPRYRVPIYMLETHVRQLEDEVKK